MRIFLKPNWSEQFIYGDKNPGIFIGREQEIKLLKNIIEHNSSSAVLIASVRGVGKTSFVHKTLSEIKDVHPVFVNIGHALANADHNGDGDKDRKLVLISLIRAIHFNEEFKTDKKLEDLYNRCFGKYIEEKSESEEKNSFKKLELSAEVKINGKTLVQLLSVLLISLGFYINQPLLRVIVGFLGLIFLFTSFKWEKNWLKSVVGKKSLVIDDSTEYLEIEFENWLRSKMNEKIVFVIDELDKIAEATSLKAIKEYKNLFNQSFAHFLFISSEKAFELVNEDREKDAENGGTFPTLFTHIIFLPLPRSEELKRYLHEIFNYDKNALKQEHELVDYLLFRSGNDFFELKRHISDVISFDDKDLPYIDTEKIKEGDPIFSSIAKLFEYIDEWFLQKNMKELKKHWKENSLLQKNVFLFLNKHYNRNFNEKQIPRGLNKLVNFLIDIGILKNEESEIGEGEALEKVVIYQWTGKYNRDVQAPLLDDDKKFINLYTKIIKIANDLDDLPSVYKTEKFKKYKEITKTRDGENLSGINLFSFYSDYLDIYTRLQKESQRISVTIEKITEANKVIAEQIDNIMSKYFDITINLLNNLFKNKSEIFINEDLNSQNYNIQSVFNSFPNLLSILTAKAYQSKVYGKTDQSKYVLIIRNFEDIEHIGEALAIIKNNTNIIIINLVSSSKYNISYPEVYIDRLGRKWKKAIKIKNFINFEFDDFRQLAKLAKKIEDHLK